MKDKPTSKAARDLKQATQDMRAALAEPDYVVRSCFVKTAQNKHAAANPVIKTPDEAHAANAQFRTYLQVGARAPEQHIALVDTHDDPRLVNVAAQHRRMDLADDAQCLDLALDIKQSLDTSNSLERCLADQMAACHRQAMKLQGRAELFLSQVTAFSNPQRDQLLNTEGVRLLNASARQMAAFQAAAETLAKLRTGGRQTVTVVHQHVQVAGGTVAVAGNVETGGAK